MMAGNSRVLDLGVTLLFQSKWLRLVTCGLDVVTLRCFLWRSRGDGLLVYRAGERLAGEISGRVVGAFLVERGCVMM